MKSILPLFVSFGRAPSRLEAWAIALLGVLAISAPSSVRADCALIPTAAQEYPSFDADGTLTSVTPQIAAPGDRVTLRAGVDCTAQPGFDPVATANRVTLLFRPLSGVTTEVEIDPATVEVSNCGDGVLSAGRRCDTLRFPIPDTDARVAQPDDDLGLAGPAEIRVTAADGTPLAFVGRLFEPSRACDVDDQEPEVFFGHFTVLPVPNPFTVGSAGVRATLDGLGNLLIPFDWRPALVEGDGAIARLVRGTARLRDGAGNPIAVPTGDFPWFRAFVDGRPVPPFLAFSEDRLVGTVDYPFSVLRLSRTGLDPAAPDTTTSLYDPADLAAQQVEGVGPILLEEALTLETLAAIPLNSLNLADGVAAAASDETLEAPLDGASPGAPFPTPGDRNGDGDALDRVVQVVDPPATTLTNSTEAVTEVGTPLSRALIAAGAGFAAWCQDEAAQGVDGNGDGDLADALFGAASADGTSLVAARDVTCDRRPFVGSRPLAADGELAIFRTFEPDGFVSERDRIWETGAVTGTVRRVSPFKSQLDGRFLFDAGDAELPGIDYAPATPADNAGILSGFLFHDDGGTTGTWVGRLDAPKVPPATPSPRFKARIQAAQHLLPNPALAVGAVIQVEGTLAELDLKQLPALPEAFDDDLAARLTIEITSIEMDPGKPGSGPTTYTFEGRLELLSRRPPGSSVNGDDDAVDGVLRVFDAAARRFVPEAQVAASSAALAGGRVGILTSEEEQDGFDGNGDGDGEDQIAQVFDLATRTLTNVRLAATDLAISESALCACVSEPDQGPGGGTDLNGDGDRADGVLFSWRFDQPLPAVGSGIACDAVEVVADTCVFTVPEEDQGGSGGTDLNDDGDRSDRVLHALDTRSAAVDNSRQAAADFVVGSPYRVDGEVAFHLVALRTCEADQDAGFEGNGDDDRDDCVAQLYKVAGPADDGRLPAVTNTRIAARICDLPGCDPFFDPYRVVGPTLSVLGPEPDGFGVATASPICLATSPPGTCDYTSNGDGLQDVIHIYNALTGRTQRFPVSRDASQDQAPFLEERLGDFFLTYCAPETLFGVDVDLDGTIGTGDVCVLVDDADEDFTLDTDGIGGVVRDVCQGVANPEQIDGDADGLGDDACDPDPETVARGSCDVDFDCDIDEDDVRSLLRDRGSFASGPGDPRDPDRDGTVTVADADVCDARIGQTPAGCSPPLPAPPPGSLCGLIGIEFAPLVAGLLAARRHRQRGSRAVPEG